MSHVLMLCHDQRLDRRVVAQAQSLTTEGHRVTLIALAHAAEGSEETTPEGFDLIRIGLNRIVPENPTYKDYARRQAFFNVVLTRLCNRSGSCARAGHSCFRLASRLNWISYKASLCARYRNRRLGDPLPFRSAFVEAGSAFQPDLVQVHDLPALEAGVELARQWGVPLVYDAHELYPEQRAFSSVQRRICAEAERRLIQHADLVFAVNDSIAAAMANRYGIPKPVTLTNAIDPPPGFNPRDGYNLLREKLRLPVDRRILLFQGGFAAHRNLDRLIVAMRQLKAPGVDLVMLGFGAFGDVLKTKAARLGLLGRRIYFLPAVPQSELLQHSASADMGIIPYPHVDLNSYWCTPNKLFEYIQAGLPILANDSPELRRFVADEGFGIVRPMHSAEQIARAIDEAFVEHDADAWKRRLAERCHAFAWKVQSEVYLAAMRPLLARTGGLKQHAGDAVRKASA